MTGLKTKAPCGHPGEAVIGAYVRCLQGCPKDPHVAPQTAVKPRRGEPGHVDFCACKACTIRRRGVKFVFRTKGGQTVEVPWDGYSNTVRWKADLKSRDRLRHWKIVDEDGDVLQDGMIDVEAWPGDPMRFDIDSITSAKLVVKADAWREWRQAAKKTNFSLDPCLPRWNIKYDLKSISKSGDIDWRKRYAEFDSLPMNRFFQSSAADVSRSRQASMRDNFGYPSGSLDDIRRAVHCVEGVQKAHVLSLTHGSIDVVITETTCTDEGEEARLRTNVSRALLDVVAAGVSFHVSLNTPMTHVRKCAEKLRLVRRYRAAGVPQGALEDAAQSLKTALKASVKPTEIRLTQENGGIEIQVKYLDSLDQHRYIRYHVR